MERDVIDEMKDQLQALVQIYPSAAYPSVISKEGVLVATLLNEDKLGIDLSSSISAIQSAATHFASIIKLTGCPHMLISGDTQIFSLYSLHADYIFVFFNSKLDTSDTFDIGDQELKERVRVVVESLNRILVDALQEVVS
jgi:predicted regulator of Ras-like GTPase activity (Roadblock/LC7/MglB family)